MVPTWVEGLDYSAVYKRGSKFLEVTCSDLLGDPEGM